MKPLNPFISKYQIKIAGISAIMIFLALIRSIIEPLIHNVPSAQLKPLLTGCLIAAFSCLVISILIFYAKYKGVILMSFLTFITLVIFKNIYLS
jgi:hypothetical protein